MPGEKRKRKRSLRVDSPEADGADVEKQEKEKSGKRKHKRKHVDALQEDGGKVKSHADDVQREVKKKKKKHTNLEAFDGTEKPDDSTQKVPDESVDHALEHEASPKVGIDGKNRRGGVDVSADTTEQKHKKRKKKHRRDSLSGAGADVVPKNSPSSPLEQAATGQESERVQSDTPEANGVNRRSTNDEDTSATKVIERVSELSTQSKDPAKATAEPPANPVDDELIADTKIHGHKRKQKDKKKKKKKQRKSHDIEEESDAKQPKSPIEPRESKRKAEVERKAELERTDEPDGNRFTQKVSPDNSTPSANPGQPAEPSETPSKTPANKQSDKADDEDRPLDDKRLPRTLFVGNVPHTATRKQLGKIFSEYSPIETIRIRNVIPVNPKIPKKAALLAGRLAKFANSFSAYIVFKEMADMEKVLERAVDGTNMTIFQDHHLRVTKALQTKGKTRQSIFVGNLPFDCTDEELITAFMPVAEECGVKLTNVRVNRDTDTGVGRGCGFVTFDDIMGIQACMNKAGEIKVRERVVRIERAFKTKNMKSKSYKRKWKKAFGQRDS